MQPAWQLLAIGGVMLAGFISPGPNFATVAATALSGARRTGVLAGAGMAAASGTWSLLVVCGVGVLTARLPWVYGALRIVGAVYLIWLGFKMLRPIPRPWPFTAVF